MPTLSLPPNPFNASCIVNTCLQQVVGILDNNPVAQVSACISMFGSPVVTTVTPTADVVFSTATTTALYTDIIVSLSTETSTVERTVTLIQSAQETVTAYSTTFLETVTSIVTAQPSMSSQAPLKKRRRACGPRPSTTLPATTSEPAESTTLSASALFPIASNCPNLEAYSSACSCISAVDSTRTVTEPASTSTSVVYTTASMSITSLSASTTTVLQTKFVTVTSTTTITNTLTTATTSTTTVTQTTTPVAPTQTSQLLMADGPQAGKALKLSSSNIPNVSTVGYGDPGTTISFVTAGGQQPWITGQPELKLFANGPNSVYGYLYFATDATAASRSGYPVTCGMDEDGRVTCETQHGFNGLYLCAGSVYMGIRNPEPAICKVVSHFTLGTA